MGIMFQPDTAGHVKHEALLVFPDGSQQLFTLQGQGVAIDFELLPMPAAPSAFPVEPVLRICPPASSRTVDQDLVVPSSADITSLSAAEASENVHPDAGSENLGKPSRQPQNQVASEDSSSRQVGNQTAQPAVTTQACIAAGTTSAAEGAAMKDVDTIHKQSPQIQANVTGVAHQNSARTQVEPGAGAQSMMWMGEVTVGTSVEGQQHVSNHGPLPLPYEWVIEELTMPPLASTSGPILPATMSFLPCSSDGRGTSGSCASGGSSASFLDGAHPRSATNSGGSEGYESEKDRPSLSGMVKEFGGAFDRDCGSELAEECPFQIQPDYGDLAAAATTRFSFSFRPTRPGR